MIILCTAFFFLSHNPTHGSPKTLSKMKVCIIVRVIKWLMQDWAVKFQPQVPGIQKPVTYDIISKLSWLQDFTTLEPYVLGFGYTS